MRIIPATIVALLIGCTVPVIGQDFLGPLQDFVRTLGDTPAQRSTTVRPTPPVVQPVTAPPVPRPRPPDLPDAPAAPAAAPAVEPEAGREPAVVEDGAAPVAEPEAAPETDRVYQAACPAVLQGLVEAEMVAPLSEGACGEQSPLLVTAVASGGRMVPLSSPVTINCQMASALPDWVAVVDGYAQAMLGSPLASVNTGTSYMCRNRNNASSGFTSEHGFANAIDVVGVSLQDGRSIAVEADWLPADAMEGRLLRLAHDAGCAGFTTTLGPEANAEHHDHLHLDMGCHGASCTARICE